MRRLAALAVVLTLLGSACQSSAARARGSAEVLRLGIFPNLTHAPALVGIATGILEDELAPTSIEVRVFNSGADAGTALLAGSIDAAYMGPAPTATLFLSSQKIAVVSGAVANGASFVVRRGAGIERSEDLRGKRIAVPGIGNTQDIALRDWLAGQGMKGRDQGGDVAVIAVDNPELPQAFAAGNIDGAWSPEPWPSLLIEAGLARTLVDERTIWPGGRFLTTHLVVTKGYLDAHPHVVRRLVRGNVEAISFIREHPAEAMVMANDQLASVGGARLPNRALDRAWSQLSFDWDPLSSSFLHNAERAYAQGVLDQDPSGILAIYRLEPLNLVLEEIGESAAEVGP